MHTRWDGPPNGDCFEAMPLRADQYFKLECLLGWQLHCHPQETPAVRGRQYNCRPNTTEN